MYLLSGVLTSPGVRSHFPQECLHFMYHQPSVEVIKVLGSECHMTVCVCSECGDASDSDCSSTLSKRTYECAYLDSSVEMHFCLVSMAGEELETVVFECDRGCDDYIMGDLLGKAMAHAPHGSFDAIMVVRGVTIRPDYYEVVRQRMREFLELHPGNDIPIVVQCLYISSPPSCLLKYCKQLQ